MRKKRDVSQRERNIEAELVLTDKWLWTKMRDKKNQLKPSLPIIC